jgi:hypothetical protein
VVDSNVLIGIQELMNPALKWNKLHKLKQSGINYLRSRAKPPLPPLTGDPPARDVESIIGKGHDLRAADPTLGETKSIPGLQIGGLDVGVSKNSAQYNALLDELAKQPKPIGDTKGGADRAIIADTLLAKGGGKPTLMTGDISIIQRLYERYGPGKVRPIKQLKGERVVDAIARENPRGFDVDMPDGAGGVRTMTVVPMR